MIWLVLLVVLVAVVGIGTVLEAALWLLLVLAALVVVAGLLLSRLFDRGGSR